MKLHLLFFSLILFPALIAQVDSLEQDVYKIDTVFTSDTVYIIDTLVTFDTVFVRVFPNNVGGDTLFLSSDNQSWSLFPQEEAEKEKVMVRNDKGQMLLTAKVSFSDNKDNVDLDGFSVRKLPPLALQIESFNDDFFSWGGQILFAREKYSNDEEPLAYLKNSTAGIAAIGTFHYGTFFQEITHNKLNFGYLDLYVSMVLRFDLHRDVVHDWNIATLSYEEGIKDVDSYVTTTLRPYFGARYYISDQFSINVEIGKGNLGMLSSSVSWVIPNFINTSRIY